MLEIAFGKLSFPIPFILARERPKRVRRRLRAAIFLDQAGGDSCPHSLIDRRRVFAAKAERCKEALTDRRDADAEFAHAVVNDGVADGQPVIATLPDAVIELA